MFPSQHLIIFSTNHALGDLNCFVGDYQEDYDLQHYLQTMFDTSAKKADELKLNLFFKESLVKEYQKYKKKYGHFSNPEELNEFYIDGVSILDWFKKHKRGRSLYFSKRKHELKGIEVPLITIHIKERPNIKYMG